MKKSLFFVFLSALLVTSCGTNRSIGNGAYSDISLVRDSDQYELKRLEPVNARSKAIFGIPIDGNVSKKEGVIVRFNGIRLNAQQRVWPILSMVALSVATGSVINTIVGTKDNTDNWEEYGEDKLGLALSSVIAIPVAGIINNQLWSDAALSRAAWNANSELLQENSEVDVFLNPKYDIQTKTGLWMQKAELEVRAMGARILTDNE